MRFFSTSQPEVSPKVPNAHAGWDLPAHMIQLMSIPAAEAVAQLLGPLPPLPKSNSFLDAMRNTQGDNSGFTRTENGALAFSSTGSALVDLFFELAPGVEASHLNGLLDEAWNEDAFSTMKIIFHARSIHEGKGFEEGFFRSMAWVYENHPMTFLSNLPFIVEPTCERERDKERDAKLAKKKMEQKGKDNMGVVELDDEDMEDPKEYPRRPHGCFDDLNDMLVLYINGQFKTSYSGKLDSLNEALAPAGQRFTMKMVRQRNRIAAKDGDPSIDRTKWSKRPRNHEAKKTFGVTLHEEKTKMGKQILCRERFDLVISTDKKFQALFLVVVDIFVKQLQTDLKLYNEYRQSKSIEKAGANGESVFGLSYAAKWAVTPGKGADKQTMIASAIALALFPGDGIKSARRRFQAEVLSPLRAALCVPEVQMSANDWDKVEYNKVPSRSMERNTPHFAVHDPTGFNKFLYKVAEGQTTISGASMFPHQVLMGAMSKDLVRSKVADLQWRTLVRSIRNSTASSLKNCLAVADVSGSMGCIGYGGRDVNNPQPIYPCIALTLLLSELAVEQWQGSFFTFSAYPSLEYISPALSLSDRARRLSDADWCANTDFIAVFKLILSRAKSSKLNPDDMVKTLFVFSDMQFDEAGGCNYGETQYLEIKREFEAANYEIPEIIFWNLSGSNTGTPKPVKAEQPGVSLLSGYSGSLMKYFLGREDDDDLVEVEVQVKGEDGTVQVVKTKAAKKETTPLETMMAVISKSAFSGVKVLD